jgi:vitamin B12 transporter
MATKPLLAFGAALAAGLPCFAQQVPQAPKVYPGGETVVTATRLAQPLDEVLRSVTVITGEDIERAGQLTLTQVLQQLGGLEMVASGGHGSSAAVFMRGANAAHTLVLVDGIRLQSATVGTTAFENIPLGQIERIEIVPGPASSLYGSDAIGGVIQIFTKGGRGAPTAQATASAGSYATGEVRGAMSARWGGTDLALSAGAFRTDGFSATRPTVSFGRFNPDRDGYRNANLSGKLAHRYGADRHEVGASILVSDGETHYDDGPDSDPRNEQRLSAYSIYSSDRIAEAWRSLLRVGAGRDDSKTIGDSFPGAFKTDQAQATWQNTFAVADGIALVAGAEYLEQEVDTTTPYAVSRRTIRSVFGGFNVDRGGHGVQASVRRDDNSQFGAPTTGSIAYGYRFSPAWRVRASYGTAFHAPSFNDLYFPGFGNPGLAPERSRNREAGIDYQAGGHRLGATWFDNRVSDLIVFVFDTETFEGRPENLERARIRGAEMSYSGSFGAMEVRAKATLQDPESLPEGLQLQRRAKRHGSVTVAHTFGAWRLGVEMVASGERFDSPNESPSSRLAGYVVFNLSVARRLAPEWTVDLRWNNVADRDYELIQGFNTPGSSVLLSVRWVPLR